MGLLIVLPVMVCFIKIRSWWLLVVEILAATFYFCKLHYGKRKALPWLPLWLFHKISHQLLHKICHWIYMDALHTSSVPPEFEICFVFQIQERRGPAPSDASDHAYWFPFRPPDQADLWLIGRKSKFQGNKKSPSGVLTRKSFSNNHMKFSCCSFISSIISITVQSIKGISNTCRKVSLIPIKVSSFDTF